MAEGVVVIKRARAGHEVHHGGSWKVAFADFAIAIMAMFLVLWLVAATNPAQKEAIADYFSNPGVYHKLSSGSPIEMRGATSISQGAPTPLKPSPSGMTGFELAGHGAPGVNDAVGMALMIGKQLPKDGKDSGVLLESLQIRLLPKGVLIDIVQPDKGPVFAEGSIVFSPFYEDLLIALAPFLAKLSSKVVISGHTNSPGNNQPGQYDHWGLSGQRALSARDILTFSGVPENQVFQVSAMGDTQPLPGLSPMEPLNRRIEILVLSSKTERLLKKQFSKRAGEPPLAESSMASVILEAVNNQYVTDSSASH